MVLVAPEVTRRKVERELNLWRENEEIYRRRGWILLGHHDQEVDVGFLGQLPLGARPIPVMAACVRIDFTNFDLWAPSVEFIDPMTGEYTPPIVQALVETDEGPRNLIVFSHPDTNRPFFCVPGIRQYHEHPQHSGDSWFLHRNTGEGSLATICDRVWRAMARNLLGIHLEMQTVPGQLKLQLRLQNAPGEVVPVLWENIRQAQQATRVAQAGGVVGQPIPPEILAMLGIGSPPQVPK
ncbi:MAG TPA: putative metal-binding protein [bacterium]|nr:putative metal-binding protein [bacterium]